MDPTVTLESMRRISKLILRGETPEGPLSEETVASLAVELAELVEALDTWLVNGGFQPKGWR